MRNGTTITRTLSWPKVLHTALPSGIDYMGPFLIVRRRETEKRWIWFFTCLTIRAAHLKIARDQTTLTCKRVLHNFIAGNQISKRWTRTEGWDTKAKQWEMLGTNMNMFSGVEI
ncbi:uncharacterized protein LOC119559720 [Drosophila subpulchrella]|uniref:uncharacterized protein LOC119559720 n=1 Tax=Drosophila subpulchrella TaxID=1486046 RepID=UPI0018A136A2|nr:uncharacterized protein LOC119559720 [Drosophila subpulchrella]